MVVEVVQWDYTFGIGRTAITADGRAIARDAICALHAAAPTQGPGSPSVAFLAGGSKGLHLFGLGRILTAEELIVGGRGGGVRRITRVDGVIRCVLVESETREEKRNRMGWAGARYTSAKHCEQVAAESGETRAALELLSGW